MIYKYEYANWLAAKKVIEISKMKNSKRPEHYKTMTVLDWRKYYLSLPKKLLIKFWSEKK